MYKIEDFSNPFDAIKEFEQQIAEYTGAPYCITTDCCTHAIEMVLRILTPVEVVKFPCRTYLSVLMTMKKLNIEYELLDTEWKKQYQIQGTDIWDCARMFEPNMYSSGAIQCLSFGRTKPIEIGRGGCILTDNKQLAESIGKMRYDGRDVFTFSPWIEQQTFNLGFHYFLRVEEAIQGLNILESKQFTKQIDSFYNYPDCRNLQIV